MEHLISVIADLNRQPHHWTIRQWHWPSRNGSSQFSLCQSCEDGEFEFFRFAECSLTKTSCTPLPPISIHSSHCWMGSTGNHMGDEGAAALGAALSQLPQLGQLNVTCKLGSIMSFIQFLTCMYLPLDCSIGSEGMCKLVIALIHTPLLTSLKLTGKS